MTVFSQGKTPQYCLQQHELRFLLHTTITYFKSIFKSISLQTGEQRNIYTPLQF